MPVKLFASKVVDEYGGEYPEAIVAIRTFSETSQTTGSSNNCADSYAIEQDLEAVSYQANYWYSEKTKLEGKRSRPLIVDEGEEFTSVLTVDLDNPSVLAVLNGHYDPVDKVLRMIEIDFKAKYNR